MPARSESGGRRHSSASWDPDNQDSDLGSGLEGPVTGRPALAGRFHRDGMLTDSALFHGEIGVASLKTPCSTARSL